MTLYIDVIPYNNDTAMVWYRDDSGKLHSEELKLPYYCYYPHPEGDMVSMFGDRVKRVDFDNALDYGNFRRNQTKLFESDISPIHKLLSDVFYKQDGPFNVGYFDIEVDFDLTRNEGYPTPENPYGEINAISLFDVKKQEYHMLMLTNDTSIVLTDDRENLPVHNYHCVTEKQLLDTFFRIIGHIDFLSTWNGDGFDIPYIMARAMRLYGINEGLKKLCRDGFKATSRTTNDEFGNEMTVYDLVGRNHLDMMALYKKFAFEVKDSYKLDNVAEAEVGEKKIEYEGNLGELYRKDPRKFFEYSLHDSRLLKMIDGKLRYVELAVHMARQATIRYNEIFGSIKYLEHAIRNYAHYDRETPVVLPDKNEDNRKEAFPGAYVFKTRVGAYGWVQSIDLTSLYPSVIRAINISPETHILQCTKGHTDFVKVVEKRDEVIEVLDVKENETFKAPAKDIWALMKAENLTISANGSIFTNEFCGLIPEVLTAWFADRKREKKLAKEYELSGDKEKAKYHDMIQNLKKLNLNSTYGAISNPYCRFFTLDCAKSITLTGQEIGRYQALQADKIVQREMNARGN